MCFEFVCESIAFGEQLEIQVVVRVIDIRVRSVAKGYHLNGSIGNVCRECSQSGQRCLPSAGVEEEEAVKEFVAIVVRAVV